MTKEEIQALADLLKPIINNQEKMQEDIAGIRTDIKDLKISQTKIELKIENEVDRSIKVTMEGHTDLNRKMDKTLALENRVETLENKISAVEYVLQNNK